MNRIVAANGLDASSLERARDLLTKASGRPPRRLEQSGAVLLSTGDSSVLRESPNGAMLGLIEGLISAPHLSRGDPSTRITLLNEHAGDVVGVELGEGHFVVWTGGGHHRWFWWTDGTATAASTHLATLVEMLGQRTSLDRSYEDFLLGFGFLPDGRTVFNDITTLPPLTTRASNESINVPIEQKPDRLTADPEADPGSELLRLLRSSVSERAAGADEHAVLLGGFDSALVCALLVEQGKRVRAYTYAFDDSSLNQANIDVLVSHLGIDHTWVPITPENLGEAFATLPDRLNAPSAQPHYQLHTSIASQTIANDGFSLIFNGDGADAALLGYPTVSRRASLASTLTSVPSVVNSTLRQLLGVQWVDRHLGPVARAGRSSLEAASLDWPASGHLGSRYVDERLLSRLRQDRPPQAETVNAIRQRLANGLDELHPTRLAFHGNGLSGASRVKVDGAVAFAGAAHYSPFAEPAVKALTAALPTEALRPSGGGAGDLGKQVLADAVLRTDLLPESVVLQPKQSPATSPIDEWIRGPLRPLMVDLISSLPFEIEPGIIDNLLREGPADNQFRDRITLSRHTLQAVGLLASYGAFCRRLK